MSSSPSQPFSVPVSILDLAHIGPGESVRDSFDASVELARHAEKWGYRRIWYAEHHNMRTIASSATSVLIGHVAANTTTIRLGSGGVMLPNHAPLTIAEQFGTLATLHPGRIDLGLGRAPGSDQQTMRAMRRDPSSADRFPQEVQELQGFLSDNSLVPGVVATPGAGTGVPLYILGSSLFGAQLAAALGLPFAFASHFAPDALEQAVSIYRREFRPSDQLDAPYVIAGVNVIAADTEADAQQQFLATKRSRVSLLLGRGRTFTDEEADMLLDAPQGRQIMQMTKYSAVGTPATVRDYLDRFVRHADADELIVASGVVDRASWLRSYELLAEATNLRSEEPATSAV
ncbi:LLM class flavin-dependent oxidoreductase [Rhodococcus sp. RS1C4]|uniref:LLM class flavin-dependent oxidoreductase n=1 Tax=Rhodococcus sp. 114MFTsu3.1 TaxID=1172184 RepID=UPI000363B114|nr:MULTISPECIES: LLM class flavin-dependent oxidoreductase [unclassified Rhodococcus (in: high G+C Gram-positive bacteria)]OZC59378.1 LLM class flavin-dependent oxidoreductase [Rhodococcus sp. RS1C4]OZC92745.1 LLM class flavin-dependent oxidoreductase [Rhodococcus sp. 06-418-1B]OZE87401.1 LLM class flavin-dependent oxidoreductase [Rhodococcus sp. 15-649-1-2]